MVDVIIKGRRTGKTTQGIDWVGEVRHGLVICPSNVMMLQMQRNHRDENIRFATQNQRTMLRGNSFDRVYIDECFHLNNPLGFITQELFPMLHMHVGNGDPVEDRILMIGTPMGPKPRWLEENKGSLFNIVVEPPPNYDDVDERLSEILRMEWENPNWVDFLQEFTRPAERLLSFEF
jgi:hypothetical protein